MQRDADEIFRVKDLSMLKSPVPTHLRKPTTSSPSTSSTAIGQSPLGVRPSPGIPLLARPTPKPMGPPPARPRTTPLSAMMKTPATATVSKTLFPLSTASTPLANRKAAAPLPAMTDQEPSLVATPIKDIKGDVKLEVKEEVREEPTAHVEEENVKADENVAPVEDAEEKHRELTDSIFNDIVDSTKFQDDKPTKSEVEVVVEVASAKVVVAKHMADKVKEDPVDPNREVKDEEPTQRRRRNTTLTQHAQPAQSAPVAVDDQLRAEVIKDDIPQEQQTDKLVVANGNQGTIEEAKEEPANNNKTVVDPAPTSTSAMVSNSKEYTIDKWYLQRIPNNPKFSGVPKESSDEWVVLVGIKADTGELWHSSIVSGRETSTRIMTGSGRLYNLKSIDTSAFIKAEFPKTLVDRFAKGFPERWKELLLAEVGRERVVVSPPRTTGKLLKMPMTSLKTPSEKTPREKKEKTPKTMPKSTKHKTPSRLVIETPKVLGSTRSGRKIVTPIPFWDTNVLSSAYKPSPTVLVKRRWGNRTVG